MTQAPEYRLVPVEPTEAMMDAPSADRPGFSGQVAREVYTAMLAAAPLPAAPAADRAVSEPGEYMLTDDAFDALQDEHGLTLDDDFRVDGNRLRDFADACYSAGRNDAAIPDAPPADRAELAKEAKRLVDMFVEKCAIQACFTEPGELQGSTDIARAKAHAIIDALARSTDAPKAMPLLSVDTVLEFQTLGEHLERWARGEHLYSPKNGYDDPGHRTATIKDVVKTLGVLYPRFKAAREALSKFAIEYEQFKGGKYTPEDEGSSWPFPSSSRLATPPTAATVIQHEDGEVSIAFPPEQKRVATVVRSQPAAATSTPCASGEAEPKRARALGDQRRSIAERLR